MTPVVVNVAFDKVKLPLAISLGTTFVPPPRVIVPPLFTITVLVILWLIVKSTPLATVIVPISEILPNVVNAAFTAIDLLPEPLPTIVPALVIASAKFKVSPEAPAPLKANPVAPNVCPRVRLLLVPVTKPRPDIFPADVKLAFNVRALLASPTRVEPTESTAFTINPAFAPKVIGDEIV